LAQLGIGWDTALRQFSGNEEQALTRQAEAQNMSTAASQPQDRRRPTREEGLAIAAGRKAARARRTSRIRKAVVVVTITAFLTPFGVIYGQMAAGKDPALASTQAAAATTAASTSSGTSTSMSSASTNTSTPTTPAPVTTQQS